VTAEQQEHDDAIAALQMIWADAKRAEDQARLGMHSICDQRFAAIRHQAAAALSRAGYQRRGRTWKVKQP
jgi:hypothetical protein